MTATTRTRHLREPSRDLLPAGGLVSYSVSAYLSPSGLLQCGSPYVVNVRVTSGNDRSVDRFKVLQVM
jgi:hypothetical protein